MKKGWKIALISLGSLIGLVAVVVAVACWLLFTPARLTSIVNKLADNYIVCENHFGKVSLSLFKTWPDMGLEVEDVVFINPYELPADHAMGSDVVQNDTLAYVGSLIVGLDAKAFLKNNDIIVHQIRLDDTKANLYTAPDEWCNWNIFQTSDEEEEDNEESSLPDNIQLKKLSVNNFTAQYCSMPQRMLAKINGLDMVLKGQRLSIAQPPMQLNLSTEVENLLVEMRDSAGNSSLYANADDMTLKAEGDGSLDTLQGRLKLTLPTGVVKMGGQTYTTEAMLASRHDLLKCDVPFLADVNNMHFTLSDAFVRLLDYQLDVDGSVALAREETPMSVDLRLNADRWQVGDLLAILPPFITQSLKGMKVDGKVSLSGHVHGQVAEGRLPLVDADVQLEKGSFSAPKMLPAPLRNINARLTANLDLSSNSDASPSNGTAVTPSPSRVIIQQLDAKMQRSTFSVTGTVDDLMGDMLVDARLTGDINLPDLRPFLPDTMPLDMEGTSRVDFKAKSRLSSITDLDMNKIQASGTMDMKRLKVRWDSIHATSPQLKVALAANQRGFIKGVTQLLGARVTGGQLDVVMDNLNLNAQVTGPDIRVGMPNILDKKQPLAAAFNIKAAKLHATMDSMLVYSDSLNLKGNVRNDTTQDNVLKQWNPDVDIDLNRAVLAMTGMSEPVRMPSFQFNYKPEVCNIEQADILWGVSDYHLSGKVFGLEDWLSHKAMLHGELSFNSQYADIDQLMNILSGMGSDEDTLQQQRIEDNVPKEANPFIVPKDVNVKLNTNIGRCVAFGNDLNQLGGSLTINDGVAILDQIGFTCKAARMQLTGVYKSPRVNHLFAGLDFHLLDIQIEELLDMIPTIDTLVPMLKAFKGKANFHLAAECSMNAFYQPKMSTLIGAAAINGKDLVVLDNASLASMARLLQFKNWREKDNNIGIDSISVEATVFRKEIIVYPFLLNLHNYQLCIGGRHTLDNNCNYHLELIKCPLPTRLAIDVVGNLAKPNISLGTVQYADMYKPEPSTELQTRTLELKRMVRQALEANVR